MQAIVRDHPRYSRSELVVDAVVHLVGLLGALGAAALLTSRAAPHPTALVAVVVYALALVMMPVTSGAYHLSRDPLRQPRLRDLDQATIFVLIAASYTPFAVLAVGGTIGTALLGFVWLVAACGVGLKLLHPTRLESRVGIALYLALGWCGLVVLPILIAVLTPTTLTLLAAGGLLYTVGVVFHLWETLPFQNAIWHTFVVAAAACHVAAVLRVLPS